MAVSGVYGFTAADRCQLAGRTELLTIEEAEHIAVEANADPDVRLVDLVVDNPRVAQALAPLWRTHIGGSPVV